MPNLPGTLGERRGRAVLLLAAVVSLLGPSAVAEAQVMMPRAPPGPPLPALSPLVMPDAPASSPTLVIPETIEPTELPRVDSAAEPAIGGAHEICRRYPELCGPDGERPGDDPLR